MKTAIIQEYIEKINILSKMFPDLEFHGPSNDGLPYRFVSKLAENVANKFEIYNQWQYIYICFYYEEPNTLEKIYLGIGNDQIIAKGTLDNFKISEDLNLLRIRIKFYYKIKDELIDNAFKYVQEREQPSSELEKFLLSENIDYRFSGTGKLFIHNDTISLSQLNHIKEILKVKDFSVISDSDEDDTDILKIDFEYGE